MGRMPADATAFAHRDKPAMLTVIHYGPAGADEAACLRSRTERVWQALRPYAAGVYVNFLGDEGEERIRAAYPPATYARLVALKDRYDPENLFRLNQNVRPSGQGRDGRYATAGALPMFGPWQLTVRVHRPHAAPIVHRFWLRLDLPPALLQEVGAHGSSDTASHQ